MTENVSFNRFSKLCGKREVLLEEMSYGDAKRIFKYYGVPTEVPDLKAEYRKAMVQHHPDRGGDEEAAKELNAAFDVLKKGEEVAVEVAAPNNTEIRKACQTIAKESFNLHNVHEYSEVSVQQIDEAFKKALDAGRVRIGKPKWSRNEKMEEFFRKLANTYLQIRTIKPRGQDRFDWYNKSEKDIISALVQCYMVGAALKKQNEY